MSNALILEGGGMRGIFAAGVIDYLLDQKIGFDNVIGVSAGACHGCAVMSLASGDGPMPRQPTIWTIKNIAACVVCVRPATSSAQIFSITKSHRNFIP